MVRRPSACGTASQISITHAQVPSPGIEPGPPVLQTSVQTHYTRTANHEMQRATCANGAAHCGKGPPGNRTQSPSLQERCAAITLEDRTCEKRSTRESNPDFLFTREACRHNTWRPIEQAGSGGIEPHSSSAAALETACCSNNDTP